MTNHEMRKFLAYLELDITGMAEAMGMSYSAIAHMLGGSRKITLRTIHQLNLMAWNKLYRTTLDEMRAAIAEVDECRRGAVHTGDSEP